MDLGFKNKTALILGAGGGFGGAIARSLAREGADLAIADVEKDRLTATAKDLASSGVKALPVDWDLAPRLLHHRLNPAGRWRSYREHLSRTFYAA